MSVILEINPDELETVKRRAVRVHNSRSRYAEHVAALYAAGLTQTELADLLGITQPAVSQLLSRARRDGLLPTDTTRARHNEDAASHQRREGGDV